MLDLGFARDSYMRLPKAAYGFACHFDLLTYDANQEFFIY